ncbi:MAG: hypothetical protein M1825_003888 [Sarcosagium campestre]|nr:MAG: hypothetical protein M1825_003888 [Sarcosagium campestre]
MEGGFSKALLMTTENGVEVVAKIPYPNAGRPRYSTASEAAVLQYLRSHTTIPVPKILAWSADPSNPVGTEYIVMEKAPGIQLSKVYDDITQTGRLSLIKGLTQLEKQFSTIQFPAYGNLYFRHSISKESERHLLDSSLDPTGSYCIGPACGPAWTDAISPADKKTRALSEHVRTVCTKAYEVATCINNKDAYNARWNMSQVLLHFFICIEDPQDSGHVPLLAYFIEKIVGNWEQMGFTDPCPIELECQSTDNGLLLYTFSV